MDIHFCDLCNESVPQSDLDLGRAFVRRGRVVCASCERAMTHAVGSASHGEETPSGVAVEVEIEQAVAVLSGDPRIEAPRAETEPRLFEAPTPAYGAPTPASWPVGAPAEATRDLAPESSPEFTTGAPFPSPAVASAAPKRSAGVVIGVVAIVFAAGAVAGLNESIRGNEAKANELEASPRAPRSRRPPEGERRGGRGARHA
jgi:hypothetical protein